MSYYSANSAIRQVRPDTSDRTPKKRPACLPISDFFRFSCAFSVYFSSPEVLPAMPVSMPPMGQIVTISSSSNPPAPA